MRAVKWIFLISLNISSCKARTPDFRIALSSPNHKHSVSISGFEPRGTIDGQLVILFDSLRSHGATFLDVKNGLFGWASDRQFILIADSASFSGISSNYYPDGTTNSKITLIVCLRDETDCLPLQKKILSNNSYLIQKFPTH